MGLLILDHCACLSIEYFVLNNPVLGCLMMLSLMLPSLVSMKRLCDTKKNSFRGGRILFRTVYTLKIAFEGLRTFARGGGSNELGFKSSLKI